jgi:ABC-type transport system involved in cytochrome bd biosynthesis fused ATPase/permease subunit
MIPCVIIAVIAMAVIALSGSAPLGAGIGLTLLLCPLLMGAVMWLLMRQPHTEHTTHDGRLDPGLRDQPQHASRNQHP